MAPPIIAIIGGTLVGSAVSLAAFGPGTGDIITQTMNRFFQAGILTAIENTRLYRLGKIDKKTWEYNLTLNGFDSEKAQYFLNLDHKFLSLTEILILWFRYRDNPQNKLGINKKWLAERIKEEGLAPERTDEILEANRPVPTLDDIIRFAVRDVFEPEQVALAGLLEDFDKVPEFKKQAAQRGLSEEDTKLYWASHWAIPSTNQALEMFQRLNDHPDPQVRFTKQDMMQFFKLADIAPRFRERFFNIAWNPLGRVDIRRMDNIGIFGTGETRRKRLEQLYGYLGYSPEDRKTQAEFTLQLNNKAPRGYTRALILQFYREGLWGDESREQAETKLAGLKYTSEQIKDILDFEDMKIINAEEQDIIEATKNKYINGSIKKESVLRDELAKAHLTDTQIRKLVTEWKREIEKKSHRVTVGQANTLRRLSIINDKKYTEYLLANGYIEEDIELLIKTFGRDIDTPDKFPSKNDLLEFLSNNIIDIDQFRSKMQQIGYSKKDIDLYLLNSGFTS